MPAGVLLPEADAHEEGFSFESEQDQERENALVEAWVKAYVEILHERMVVLWMEPNGKLLPQEEQAEAEKRKDVLQRIPIIENIETSIPQGRAVIQLSPNAVPNDARAIEDELMRRDIPHGTFVVRPHLDSLHADIAAKPYVGRVSLPHKNEPLTIAFFESVTDMQRQALERWLYFHGFDDSTYRIAKETIPLPPNPYEKRGQK